MWVVSVWLVCVWSRVVLVGFYVEMYCFGWFRLGMFGFGFGSMWRCMVSFVFDIEMYGFGLFSIWRCMVLFGFDMEMYGFGWFRCGDE